MGTDYQGDLTRNPDKGRFLEAVYRKIKELLDAGVVVKLAGFPDDKTTAELEAESRANSFMCRIDEMDDGHDEAEEIDRALAACNSGMLKDFRLFMDAYYREDSEEPL